MRLEGLCLPGRKAYEESLEDEAWMDSNNEKRRSFERRGSDGSREIRQGDHEKHKLPAILSEPAALTVRQGQGASADRGSAGFAVEAA